ncbi:hypothetical protein EDD21DRAFT_407841 [Dissophora ornata]|nr:hypothetical protein EDD21DRAFT_407841 [Dissophora ornata]
MLFIALDENLPLGFRQDEELQKVQSWNARPQKARDGDNKDSVVAREAGAAGDVYANNQATEPRPKAKRTDYMIFQQSLVEEDPSRHILLLLGDVSCHTVAARSSHEFSNIRTTAASESGADTETENGAVTTAPILSKGALRAKAASTKIKISNKEAWQFVIEARPPSVSISNEAQSATISVKNLLGIENSIGPHSNLLASISKLLDRLPFVRFAIEEHQDDDAFNSFFIPLISTTGLMAEDSLASTSESENTDNCDYILEIKPELQVTSERGSPLKPKLVRKPSRTRP